jgi:hypothetical protein
MMVKERGEFFFFDNLEREERWVIIKIRVPEGNN